MSDTKTGPREYRPLSIPGATIIRPKLNVGKYDGWLIEPVDFSEASYYLGYKFDPRSMYATWAPEGIVRGGHMESRSKLVTILSGLVYYVLVDMRPGENQGKVEQFYLGDGIEEAWGRSVLVPEGVIDAYVVVSENALHLGVGDQPYNAFYSLKTLDLFDKNLGINWPVIGDRATYNDSHRDNQVVLPKEEFIKSLY